MSFEINGKNQTVVFELQNLQAPTEVKKHPSEHYRNVRNTFQVYLLQIQEATVQNRLPSEVADTPTLEAFKTSLNGSLSSMVQWEVCCSGVGTG